MESLRNLSIPVCHIPGFCNLLLQNDYLHNRQATSEAHFHRALRLQPSRYQLVHRRHWHRVARPLGSSLLVLPDLQVHLYEAHPHPFIPDLRPYVPAHHAPPVLYLFRPGRPPVFRLIMERPTRQCRYKMDYIRLPGDHLCPHSPLLLGHPTTIRTVHPLASFLRQPYHHGSSGRARPRATDVGSHGRLCGISGKHRP